MCSIVEVSFGDIGRFINHHHLNFLFIIGNIIADNFIRRENLISPPPHTKTNKQAKKKTTTKQNLKTNKQKYTLLPNKLSNLITSSKS